MLRRERPGKIESMPSLMYLVPATLAFFALFEASTSFVVSYPQGPSGLKVRSCRGCRVKPLSWSLQASGVSRDDFIKSGKFAAASVFFSAVWNMDPGAAMANIPTGLAPDFEMPNSKGEGTTSLKDLLNTKKWTVLYFYPGAFTTGCTLEARNFQRDYKQYDALNAQIVGVSVDSVEKNGDFCNKEGLNFFMLSDKNGVVSKQYGSALSIPGFGTFSNRQTYLISPDGQIRWVFQDVESHVARHSTEVLDKLTELTGTKVSA